MEHIDNLIKPREKRNALTHQDNSTWGPREYHCSTFIKKRNLLVKGEYDNPNLSIRRALIILSNPDSGELKGGR